MSRFVVPFGFKCYFDPEDHELMVCLSCKANGEQLPCDNDFITEIDLYDIPDPGELFINNDKQKKIIYVFTKVKKLSEKGQNVNRKVSGDRFWRGLDRGRPIYDEVGREVGLKRNFSLMDKKKKNLGFHITEFILNKKSLEKAKYKDFVICKIKRNLKKTGRCIGIHGDEDFGSQGNPSDNNKASSTDASNPSDVCFVGLSDPPQNSYSQNDVTQTLNAWDALPELPEYVDESMIQEMVHAYNSLVENK